jgi:hypothetical protein
MKKFFLPKYTPHQASFSLVTFFILKLSRKKCLKRIVAFSEKRVARALRTGPLTQEMDRVFD